MVHTFTPLHEYPGRKAAEGQFQKILAEIPKCITFIEAMCGSAYISSLVKGCSIIINDIDKGVIEKINCLGATKVNRHYDYMIDTYDAPGTVFYFDPPYMMHTRSFKGKLYKHDWNDYDHKDFLKAVQRMKSHVMISHYPCDLYDKMLKKWRKISYSSMTRAGVRKENLYMNYPQPVLLQCYQHIGSNFTHRQQIKRKIERLIKRLERETPQERAAILSSIVENYNYI